MNDRQIVEVLIQGFQINSGTTRDEAIKAVIDYCQYGIDHPECTSQKDVDAVIEEFMQKLRNGEYK